MSTFALEIGGRRVGRFQAVEAANGSATPPVRGAARRVELRLIGFQPEAAFARVRTAAPVGPGAVLLRDSVARIERKWRFERIAIERRAQAGLVVTMERLSRA